MEIYKSVTNILMGVIMVGFGIFALYKTAAEGRQGARPGPTIRTVRLILGLLILVCGILAVLNGTGLFSVV